MDIKYSVNLRKKTLAIGHQFATVFCYTVSIKIVGNGRVYDNMKSLNKSFHFEMVDLH